MSDRWPPSISRNSNPDIEAALDQLADRLGAAEWVFTYRDDTGKAWIVGSEWASEHDLESLVATLTCAALVLYRRDIQLDRR